MNVYQDLSSGPETANLTFLNPTTNRLRITIAHLTGEWNRNGTATSFIEELFDLSEQPNTGFLARHLGNKIKLSYFRHKRIITSHPMPGNEIYFPYAGGRGEKSFLEL